MSSGEEKVAHLCSVYEGCVYRKDYASLSSIYHDSILAFDLWDKGIYETKADWSNSMRDWLTSLPENEKVEVSFELLKAELNGEVGFAYGFVTYRAIDQTNTELRKMKNRFSWGLVKVDGNWLIAHQHTSVPIDLKDTKAIFFS